MENVALSWNKVLNLIYPQQNGFKNGLPVCFYIWNDIRVKKTIEKLMKIKSFVNYQVFILRLAVFANFIGGIHNPQNISQAPRCIRVDFYDLFISTRNWCASWSYKITYTCCINMNRAIAINDSELSITDGKTGCNGIFRPLYFELYNKIPLFRVAASFYRVDLVSENQSRCGKIQNDKTAMSN